MAKPNQETPDQETTEKTHATRGENARRFGKYGLLAGVVLGLASGGILGVVKSALLFGGVGLATGAVAGNKLNSFINKITSFLPWRRKDDAAAEGQGGEPEVVSGISAPEQGVAVARGIDSLDPAVLAEIREQAGKGRAGAEVVNAVASQSAKEQGIPEDWVETVSRKQPTHPAHMTHQ